MAVRVVLFVLVWVFSCGGVLVTLIKFVFVYVLLL